MLRQFRHEAKRLFGRTSVRRRRGCRSRRDTEYGIMGHGSNLRFMSAASKRIKAEVGRHMALPYTREIVRNKDGTWFARVVEFPGCMTEGDTADEAMKNLDEAMAGWIAVHLEDNDPIPPPLSSDQYSGKFLMRVPRTLHRELARRADLEGVSLNQYALSALARAVGMES